MLETRKAPDTSQVTIPVDETIDNQQVRDRAYIAGLMDGEGTFCLEQNKHKGYTRYTPRISMGNTNQGIALAFKTFLEMNDIKFYESLREFEKPLKALYVFEIKRFLMVKKFIELVGPYLRGKKRQAELLLKFINSRLDENGDVSYRGNSHSPQGYPSWVDDVWLECRLLNGGGRRPRSERDNTSNRMQQLSNLNDLTSNCTVTYYAKDKVCPSVKAEAAQAE
jgi:hypothetical protein